MVRDLFGRIAALWRAVAAPAAGNRPRAATAKETETMDADGLADGTGLTAGDTGFLRASPALDDLLAHAMTSIGIDVDDFAMREALLLRDMRRVCRSCHARSRCRRDLGTGDFARRYRHYCPNAESLALIAAGATSRTAVRRPAGRT